jgi:hypothetical protein
VSDRSWSTTYLWDEPFRELFLLRLRLRRERRGELSENFDELELLRLQFGSGADREDEASLSQVCGRGTEQS